MREDSERPRPGNIEELSALVRSVDLALPTGGGTKPALLWTKAPATIIEMGEIAGIVEYLPEEYTISAKAGTSLRDVACALAENSQYLPFDPPLSDLGATVGGTVAAGLSGAGRYRFGGLRDFILGIRYVDGSGNLVTGGGKVVKNAAGFDFPKLFVGSVGRLGILTEVTFKVFPAPDGYATLKLAYEDLASALAALRSMHGYTIDLHALDIEAPATLCVRLGGIRDALSRRIDRVTAYLEHSGEVLEEDRDTDYWRDVANFSWVPEGWSLVKIPLSPSRATVLDKVLRVTGSVQRYIAGAALAWVASPPELSVSTMDRKLAEAGFSGLLMRGEAVGFPILGRFEKGGFMARVKAALDENGRFPGFD